MPLKFPKHFLFGAATSAHQVEGRNINDWSAWEQKNAARLVAQAKAHPLAGTWPEHLLRPENGGAHPLEEWNYISGNACDHYHHFEKDFDIAHALGHNAHRFSVEWSRIEPEEGIWNEKELAHYADMLEALRTRGMEPIVTLWHFTLPRWLAKKGGILSPRFPELFARYAKKIVSVIGPECKYILTMNEPEIIVLNAYYRGVWPPQSKGALSAVRAMRALVKAHRAAYKSVRMLGLPLKVGVAFNFAYFEAAPTPANLIARFFASQCNHYLPSRMKAHLDFIGVNYYFHSRFTHGTPRRQTDVMSDMGWEIFPKGIYHVLQEVAGYQKPIIITENGVADARDALRSAFIHDHLEWIARAINEGIDVRGYLYWSLLDNFEWDKGFWPRFGLVAVDYRTLERTIRPSAWVYKKIIDEVQNDTKV